MLPNDRNKQVLSILGKLRQRGAPTAPITGLNALAPQAPGAPGPNLNAPSGMQPSPGQKKKPFYDPDAELSSEADSEDDAP